MMILVFDVIFDTSGDYEMFFMIGYTRILNINDGVKKLS